MSSLTIKGLDPVLLERLRQQARRKNLSLNAYVIQLLSRWLGVERGVETFTDLNHLAGAWTQEDERAFLENTRPLREIDEDVWR